MNHFLTRPEKKNCEVFLSSCVPCVAFVQSVVLTGDSRNGESALAILHRYTVPTSTGYSCGIEDPLSREKLLLHARVFSVLILASHSPNADILPKKPTWTFGLGFASMWHVRVASWPSGAATFCGWNFCHRAASVEIRLHIVLTWSQVTPTWNYVCFEI